MRHHGAFRTQRTSVVAVRIHALLQALPHPIWGLDMTGKCVSLFRGAAEPGERGFERSYVTSTVEVQVGIVPFVKRRCFAEGVVPGSFALDVGSRGRGLGEEAA